MNDDSAANRGLVKRRGAQRTNARRHPLQFIAFPIVAAALVGCAEITPRFELRDDYMFKRFLQPDRVVSEVERDELGNPIIPDGSSE